jgi:predicted RNA-binding Zn ribbon-like protein
MMEHTGSKPAPGRLRLIQTFVNSAEVSSGREDFDSPARLGEWLLERGLIAAADAVDEDGLRLAVEAREALRSLLLTKSSEGPDDPAAPAPGKLSLFSEAPSRTGADEARETLDGVARRARLTLRLQPDGSAALTAQAGGVEGALGMLLAIAFEAMNDGTWARLKVCPEDTCRWAFYDSSRNCSGTWCTMASCGNRHKARHYRDRRRAAPAS